MKILPHNELDDKEFITSSALYLIHIPEWDL